MNARRRLHDLVGIPSTEHDDPAPILAYVKEVGCELGARVVPVKNGSHPAILLAWGTPRLLFSGHLDTVPRSGTWRSKTGQVRAGRMYGRGTTDMKAGCAAMLTAAARAKDAGDFGILFTTDEETHMKGAEAAVAKGLLAHTELVVVGEPTGLRVNRGQKGILQVALTTEGTSGHASMPWAGANAIARMGRLVAALAPLAGTTRSAARTMTASPDRIEGGVAMNVIADRCRLELDVRYAPTLSQRAARARLRKLLAAAKTPYAIEDVQTLPSVASRAHPLAERLRARSKKAYGFCDFATEAAVFAPTGTAFVVFGPGEPHHCHVTDESVDLGALDRATEHYVAAITTRS